MANNQGIGKIIEKILDKKKLSVREFELKIGVSNGTIGKAIQRNGSIGFDKIQKTIEIFPDLNPSWLLTGEGEMLKSELHLESSDKIIPFGLKETQVLRIKALAGIPGLSWEEVSKSEVQLLPGYSFRMQLMVRIEGDSMSPAYNDGDVVLISPVLADEVIDRKVYVLHTEEGTLIKRLVVDRKRKVYMLVSDNPYYLPMALDEGQIHGFFRVLCRCVFE